MSDANKIAFNISPFLDFDTRLLKGWNTDFIIAGEFIHNVLSNNSLHYVDFYIFTEKGFHTLLNFFDKINYNYKPEYAIKTTYYIEISNKVRLFNALDTTPIEIINNMEADIVACFYDGEHVHVFPGCEDAIDSLTVIQTADPNKCNPSTILNAIHQGYKISCEIVDSLGIALEDKPQMPTDNLHYSMSSEDLNEITNEYDNDLIQYMQSAIELSDEQYFDLCEKETLQYHTQQQSMIKVYNLTNATQLLLPYVLSHSIKEQIKQKQNFNAGYGPPVDIMMKCSLTLSDTKVNKETQLSFPPPPNRPLPQLPPQQAPQQAPQ